MTTRVPPHDITTEAAYLGAALLTRDAAQHLTDGTLTPADFYARQHQRIAAAIAALTARGDTVDIISVAHTLGDQLHQIRYGPHTGRGALLALIADTPGSAAAGTYATTIAADAHLRRIITWCGETAEQAYQRQAPTTPPPQPADTTTELHDINLATINTTTPHPTLCPIDGAQPLLYPARSHDLHGEPGTGKTWLALHACHTTLQAGGTILWLDWEDTPNTFINRAHLIGIPDTLLTDRTRVRYCTAGHMGGPELAQLARIAEDIRPTLTIIDAGGAALAADHRDENTNSDVLAWTARVITPLTRTGSAVTSLDHVTKNPDTRTRGSRGASAKLQTITGASYAVKIARPFASNHAGRVTIHTAKDRCGTRPIGPAAIADFTPHSDGGLTIALTADTNTGADWQPTELMAQIMRLLRDHPDATWTRTEITRHIGAKRAWVLRAITELLTQEALLETPEGRGMSLRLPT